MADTRAVAARQHHRAAGRVVADAQAKAADHRRARDELVRQLRREDPVRWTHAALAAAVGCSPELVAVILRPPAG